ncbi:MAG: DUF4082 domain-containing protein [Candidatus Eremiobacteraeota bacterium]|nr:DUF4082 domain-containing protein [Candidatus Eremiobacteraeota bacterium]
MNKLVTGAILFLGLSCSALAMPALSVIDTSQTSTGIAGNVRGWEFTTNSDISVTALSIYDAGLDGLAEAHNVGIFNSSGTLLASVIIPSGTTAGLVNEFRSVAISPLTLLAGQTFRIAATYNIVGDPYLNGSGSSFLADPAITYVTSYTETSSTLTYPTVNPGNARIGPNFEFNLLAVGAPEINGLCLAGMMSSMVLLGLVERRRRPD